MKTQPGKQVWSSFRQGVAVALAALAMYACLGATRIVPDFSSTIQAAIDSSAAGDTVLVRPGTYVENLHTDGKALTLKALGSPETTIIDGNQQGSVIWVTADAHIEGFTIRNGLNEYGGGIRASGPAEITILNNQIVDNQAGYSSDIGSGGGIYLYYSTRSVISENVFFENHAREEGGGIYAFGGVQDVVHGNIFENNGSHLAGGAIGGGVLEISENLILRNWSDTGGGGIAGYFGVVRNNNVVGNYIKNPVAPQGAGIHVLGGTPVIDRNIVVHNSSLAGATGVGIKCGSSSASVSLTCNDVWGNDVDWLVVSGCDTTGLGNFSEDPRFCDPNANNYELDATSPCTADNSPGCGLVGAYPVGCMTPSIRTTWGRLKVLYDNQEAKGKK